LRVKSGSFRRSLKKLLTEHRITSQRFLNTIVSEGASLYQRALADGTRWVDNALLPIFQNVQERRQMLDDQLLRIKALSHAGSDLDSRRRELMSMLEDIDRQIGEADSMLRTLRRPAPYQQEKKVVPILNRQTDSAQTPAQSAKAPYA
jgi:Rad3-related DNA helicase